MTTSDDRTYSSTPIFDQLVSEYYAEKNVFSPAPVVVLAKPPVRKIGPKKAAAS